MMGGMLGGFGGYGGFGLIGLLLNLVITIGLVVGLVLLLAWLWRRVSSDKRTWSSPQSEARTAPMPRDIVQARYARGEITREQYQQMLADLS